MSKATNVVQNANINKSLEISSTMVLRTGLDTCGYVYLLDFNLACAADNFGWDNKLG